MEIADVRAESTIRTPGASIVGSRRTHRAVGLAETSRLKWNAEARNVAVVMALVTVTQISAVNASQRLRAMQ